MRPISILNQSTLAITFAAGLALSLAGCETTQQHQNSNRSSNAYSVVGGEQTQDPGVSMTSDREINAILNEGRDNSQVMDHLRTFTEVYGPRLTGSTRLRASQRWARDAYSSWGLSNSRIEEFGTLATRFDRGPSSGKIFIPDSSEDSGRSELRAMEFSTLSWSPGTDGPVIGHIAHLPTTMAEYESSRGNFGGAWVMIKPDFAGDGGIRSTGYMMRDRFDERHQIRTGTHEMDTMETAETVSGDVWNGSFNYNGSLLPTKLVLDDSSNDLTGSMSIEGFAEGPITNVSKDGDTMSFNWAHSMGTSDITITMDAETASGKSVAASGNEYEIELSKLAPSSMSPEELSEHDRINALAAVLAENPAGFVSSSKDERVWTTSANNWRTRELKDYPVDVEVNIRQSDYDFINTRINEGLDITVEFDLDHKLEAGPIPMYNVLAEIPGTEFPEEVVIISAHLDSWDGPGSKGAVDNATGCAVVTEAARIIMEAGVQPKRTILVALWSGEEQGLIGSKEYVNALSDEQLANISAAFVDDGGTNYQGGVPAADFMVEYLSSASAATNGQFFSKIDHDAAMNDDDPENDERAGFLDVNIRPTGGKIETHSGSDHASFNRKGVPGFFWDEVGRANYRYAWHTQNDTYDQAIEEYLVQSATNMALVALNLANAPELLPRDGIVFTDEATIKRNLEPVGSIHNHHHD